MEVRRKRKLLLLYGLRCTKRVWDDLAPYFVEYEVDYVEYPHEVTLQAKKVNDLTQWVYENYGEKTYDAIVGHSLGGIIALQLVSDYNMKAKQVFLLDTNLRPAEAHYRNLMTPEHMQQYGDRVLPMLKAEAKFYTPALFEAIQNDFDFTELILSAKQAVFALYGDREQPEYERKISALNLPDEVLGKIELRWIEHACHMIMVENPSALAELIQKEVV
jgi:pimeloyl-ACP methyl ester carboxylesterase